jgi:hypothetical protein
MGVFYQGKGHSMPLSEYPATGKMLYRLRAACFYAT